MLRTLFTFSIIVMMFLSAMAQDTKLDSVIIDSATVCAEHWLQLIDEEKYGESWEETSTLFKGQVTKDQWVATISSLKSSFGKTISRKLFETHYRTTLPGAPDGEYVVILFKTKFENKDNAIETITPMKNKDDSWHVSGYFIK